MRFIVNGGKTVKVQVYSDVMDTDFIERIPALLQGLPVSFSTFAKALFPLTKLPQYAPMAVDLQTFLLNSPQRIKGDEVE